MDSPATCDPKSTPRPGGLRPADAFFAINVVLVLLMAGSVYYPYLVGYVGAGHLAEFLVYGIALLAAITTIWLALKRLALPWWVFVVLQAAICLNYAGGFIHAGNSRLYDQFVLGIRFDKIIHFTNAILISVALRELFRIRGLRTDGLMPLLIALLVMGLGACWEVLEYLVTINIPRNGVGGYDNNMQDMLANLLGGAAFVLAQVLPIRGALRLAVGVAWPCRRVAASLGVLGLALLVWCLLSKPLDPADGGCASFLEYASRRTKTLLVNAAGEQVRLHVRRKLESNQLRPELTVPEMIEQLFDRDAEPFKRYRDAYWLAKLGTPESTAALKRFFETASVEEKAAVAQLLGAWGDPQQKQWLWSLLEESEATVAIGAIRGLSLIGGDDVRFRLEQYLNDPRILPALRTESARGLATMGSPAACDVLIAATENNREPAVVDAVMESLGHFPFSKRIETAFRGYLDRAEISGQRRADAVESLAQSSTAAVPFLLEVASASPDWRIRAGAAWAIGNHDPVPQCGNILLDMVAAEDDEVVRRRLYEALLAQSSSSGQRLLDSALREKDLPARIAGFNSVGATVRTHKDLEPAFDSRIVPELLKVALSETSVDLRLRAVFALRRAQTASARTALAEISKASEQRVAQAARSGLQ